MPYKQPTIQHAQKIIKLVSLGLTEGLGDPHPGEMCVEAVVCFAMGEPHDDEPKCVAPCVASFKIDLNDNCGWDSNLWRGRGLKRIAVAQLGTHGKINSKKFEKAIRAAVVQLSFPRALEKAAREQSDKELSKEIRAIVPLCSIDPHLAYKRAVKLFTVVCRPSMEATDIGDLLYGTVSLNNPGELAEFFGNVLPLGRRRNHPLRLVADVCETALRALNAPGVEFLDKLLPRE